MAHLNLVAMHPFSDGNGRTGRCIHTALLARAGIVAPELSSIEEYIARNQWAYYAALDKVSGGHWAPKRDPRPWMRFCLVAHNRQANAFVRRAGDGTTRVLGPTPKSKKPRRGGAGAGL
jgi:hypothetical protein